MSLDSILAHVFITNVPPYIPEEELDNLKLVNKNFCALVGRLQVTFYLGGHINNTPIDDDTIRALRVLAATQPIPDSQRIIITQALFAKCANALSLFQPQNAVQLKNQFRCIWHLNYSIPREPTTSVQTLHDAIENTHAKIGEFSIHRDGIKMDFNVSAVAYLYNSNNTKQFKFSGNTRIYIHPAEQPLPLNIDDRRKLHGLAVINTIRQSDGGWTNEEFMRYNEKMDLREQWFNIELESRSVVTDPKGSNRELDQKILQIMVEILQQNKSKSHLRIISYDADYVVLVMGGFMERGDNANRSNETIQQIMEFRANPESNLFPPFHDHSQPRLTFNREQLEQKNVRLSREQGLEPESWIQITKREPILYRGGGRIPDYWTTKPVDERDQMKLNVN